MECVMCNEKINPVYEDYTVGVSLGEYWCRTCAEKEREKLREAIFQTMSERGKQALNYDGDKNA